MKFAIIWVGIGLHLWKDKSWLLKKTLQIFRVLIMCISTSLERHKEKSLSFCIVIYFRDMCRISIIEMTKTEMY